MNASILVRKHRNHCDVLRDDGLSYSDYVEPLTYLLFLKRDRAGDAQDKEAVLEQFRLIAEDLKAGEAGA